MSSPSDQASLFNPDQRSFDGGESSDGSSAGDTAAVDAGGSLLLLEAFNAPVALESDGVGSWRVAGGMLEQTTCLLAATEAVLPGYDWSDVKVSTRVRIDQICALAGTLAGLLFRVSSISGCNNSYYACIINPSANTLGLAAFTGSCQLSYKATHSANVSSGQWYELKATARGDNIGCELYGGILPPSGVAISWTDTTPLPPGSVGFMAGQLAASFDDLEVRER